MEHTSNTKNFVAHGGGEWVIGGKLTFLPGAVVEGGEGLFDTMPGGDNAVVQLPFIPDSTATNVATLRENYNRLLAALRTTGLMMAEQPETPAPDTPDSPDTGT